MELQTGFMKREISSKAFDELTAKKVAYICS
jgi:hypothetical protein